jgi:hypothetical protein
MADCMADCMALSPALRANFRSADGNDAHHGSAAAKTGRDIACLAESLVLIASVLRDHGALPECAALYEEAVAICPDNASYALNRYVQCT